MLHARIIVLTIFINFNVSIRDPNISHRLKVKIQITRADHVAKALLATLDHEFIYKLQDHVINFSLPTTSERALSFLANHQEQTPYII